MKIMTEDSNNPYLLRSDVCNIKYIDDKSKEVITWYLWPGEVPWGYTYGGVYYSGYFSAGTSVNIGGIIRIEAGVAIRITRRGIFEGIRIHQIKWRKNWGEWNVKNHNQIRNENDATISVTSDKNGDVYDLQVTYELCSMGFPHRNCPFLWFIAKGSTYYTGGEGHALNYYKPGHDPGRSYSKVSSEAWVAVSIDWGDPRDPSVTTADKTKAGWTYKNGISTTRQYNETCDGAEGTSWSAKYTYEYQKSYCTFWGMGWKSESGNDKQYARKSAYWTYRRTYCCSITTSGIIPKPDPVAAPHTPAITVVPNHCSSDLRGEEGTVHVRYSHPTGNSGEIILYAYQFDPNNGSYIKKTVYGGYIGVSSGQTYTYNVNFKDLGFNRSREVRYVAVARVYDSYYKNTKYTSTADQISSYSDYGSRNWLWNNYAKGHYFNDEGASQNVYLKQTLDYTRKATIYWDNPNDPDGDRCHYSLIVQRPETSGENAQHEWFNGGWYGGVNGDVWYSYRIDNIWSTSYDLDMSRFRYLESVTVWVVAYDDYYNSYYYASKPMTFKKVQSPSVKLEWQEIRSGVTNPTNLDNMIDGTRSKVKITYYHEKYVGGKLDLELFQALDYDKNDGYRKVVISNIASFSGSNGLNGESKEVVVDFKNYGALDRSKAIYYFAKATDNNGTKSWIAGEDKWANTKWAHYYNDEPGPVYPAIDIDHSQDRKDFAHLVWDPPIDPDYDSKLWYAIYLATGDPAKDTEVGEFGTQKEKRNYHKVYYTTACEFNIDITEYTSADDILTVWIESHDQKWNNYYHCGESKQFQNTAVAPNKPYIVCYNMYDENDGLKCSETGEVYVHYSHDQAWDGYVKLYAMAKYKRDNNEWYKLVNVFEKQLGKEEVLMQDSIPFEFVVDYRVLFGDTWDDRDCEIRYYATARTANRDLVDEASSEGNIAWVPTVRTDAQNYSKWFGIHYYNEEPAYIVDNKPQQIVLSLDEANSDIFNKVRLQWTKTTDRHGDIIRYEVYVKPEHKTYSIYDEMQYFTKPQPDADEAIRCDLLGITSNTYLDFDMTGYEIPGETYTVFIRAIDGWHNSYYYDSNKLTFTKKEYAKPETKIKIDTAHGEFGNVEVIYTHPDAELTGEDAVDRGPCTGKIWVYAYIESYESKPINITSLFGETVTEKDEDGDKDYMIMEPSNAIESPDSPMIKGESIKKLIDFREIERLGKEQNLNIYQYRSNYITYYAIAKDIHPGTYSIDSDPDDIGASVRDEYLSQVIDGEEYYFTHFYNEEPPKAVPYIGSPLTEEDRPIFGFNYTVIEIEPIFDPDRDPMHYYVFIDTPDSMGDAEITTKVYKEVVEQGTRYVTMQESERIFNRCYRIDPIYKADSDGNIIGVDQILYYNVYKFTGQDMDSFYEKSSWEFVSKSRDENEWDDPYPSLKIDYIEDNYPISGWVKDQYGVSQSDGKGAYTYWVEARDDYKNSYYRTSDAMTIDRVRHQKPEKPEIIVTPAHGENGDIKINFKHPEQLDSLIYLYAYFTDSEGNEHSGLVDILNADFTKEEKDNYYRDHIAIVKELEYTVDFTKEIFGTHEKFFERSTAISYYAVAADKIVGYISELEDEDEAVIDDFDPDTIPVEARRDGHYFNEEPEVTHPYYLFTEKEAADMGDSVFNKGVLDNLVVEETPYETMTLMWEMPPRNSDDNKDIDGDIVDYYVYMHCPSKTLPSKNTDPENPDHIFYGNYTEMDNYNLGIEDLGKPLTDASAYEQLDEDAGDKDNESDDGTEPQCVTGVAEYNQLVIVPHEKIINKTVKDKNGKTWFYYTFDLTMYDEDGNVTIWIETRDRYENSYYRSGYSITLRRGHKARPIQTAYPNNVNNTVYCKRPRVLIELAKDDLKQEVIVTWKNIEYSNKKPEQQQYFSSVPKITQGEPALDEVEENDCFVVFRPPVAYTEISGSKVQYSVKVNNTCTTSESRYFSYMYYKFGDNLTEDTFIPIKAVHVNEFRKAAQRVLDAYGKSFEDPGEYQLKDRAVVIKQIVDNEDYNEIARPLKNLNNFLNTCDKCDNNTHDITDDIDRDDEHFIDMAENFEVIGPYFEDDNSEFTVPDHIVMDVDYEIKELLKIINSQDYYMTSDFIDWKILLYILQNM